MKGVIISNRRRIEDGRTRGWTLLGRFSLAQLPSGDNYLFSTFFGEGLPFKVNQPEKDALFSHGPKSKSWANRCCWSLLTSTKVPFCVYTTF